MGRLNNIIKWIVMNVNFAYGSFAVAIIGMSIFILGSNWGGLDRSFFIGWCTIAILFGFLIVLISVLGCTGVNYQIKTTGLVTGRRVLFLYQLTLILIIVADIFAVSAALTMVKSLSVTKDSLNTDEIITYDKYEAQISQRFNDFFFSGTVDCTDTKYVFFWSWVDDHCNDVLTTATCVRCDDYSVTSCAVNEYDCYRTDEENNILCPYEACRLGVLNYLVNWLRPIANYMLAFTIFQVALMILTCMLICYTERDNLETMLIKSGTIPRPIAPMVDDARPAEPPRSM